MWLAATGFEPGLEFGTRVPFLGRSYRPSLLRPTSEHSSSRDCLKSPDSPETKVVEAYETDQKGPFCCGMPTILAHETPLSDFLDSFSRHFSEYVQEEGPRRYAPALAPP
jgi:hypothetical protein